MRVAQSRLLNGEGSVITTDELLSASTPRRPRLSLKLNFGPHNSLNVEEGESFCETPMAPTTSKLPEPLPFVKIKSGPPSAIEMLDSEKMGELWKSQDSRRVSWSTSPSSSTPTYLPSYTSSREDLRIEESHRLSGVVNTPSSPYNYSPTLSPSGTSCNCRTSVFSLPGVTQTHHVHGCPGECLGSNIPPPEFIV